MTHATEDPKDVRTKTPCIRVLGCGDSKNMSKVRVLKKTYTYVQRRTYTSFWGVCGDMLVQTVCPFLACAICEYQQEQGLLRRQQQESDTPKSPALIIKQEQED
jgi:hypothetical protein